jgi:hypothetical protein
MKITARTSGGFAGLRDCFELDTACHADGQAVESLLDQLDFFGARPQPALGADLVRWEITADDGRRCHTVVLHEDPVEDAANRPCGAGWQALIARLREGGRAADS